MIPAPIYPDVSGECTPVGFRDWYVGYGTTVRLPDDLSDGKRTRVLARSRVAAALRRWER